MTWTSRTFNLLELFREDTEWERLGKGAIDADDVFGEGKGEYFLDPNLGRRYLTQYAGLLMERTVGHVDVRRTSLRRRAYRVRLTIEGQSGEQLESVLNVDLDAPSPSGLILDPASLSFAVSQAGGSDTRSVTIEKIAGRPSTSPSCRRPAARSAGSRRLSDCSTARGARAGPFPGHIQRHRARPAHRDQQRPNNPHTIAVSGKGRGGLPPDDPDAPPPPGEIELAPGLVNFGSVALNSSETRTVTITNKTGAAVTLSAAASPANAQFRWSGFQAVLVNNAKRTISIAFHPAANGPQSGRFTVRNTATGESHSVDRIGRGGIGGFPAPPDGQ